MIIDRSVKVNYTNERGLSVDLVPWIADAFRKTHVFYLKNDVSEDLPTDIFAERQVGWHGEMLQAFYLGSRIVNIEGIIFWDADRPDLIHQYKRHLEKCFNPTYLGRLNYSRGDGKKIFYLQDCVPMSGIRILTGAGFITFSVSLKATNPFWQMKPEVERLSYTQKNIVFPLSVRPKQYFSKFIPHSNRTYMGIKRNNLDTVVDNIGDVTTGFRVVIIANGHIENPSLYNIDTGATLKLVGNPGTFIMEKNDTVEIISTPKESKIWVNKTERGLRYLAEGYKFFVLPQGKTRIGFNAEKNVSLMDVLLYYAPQYLGAEN